MNRIGNKTNSVSKIEIEVFKEHFEKISNKVDEEDIDDEVHFNINKGDHANNEHVNIDFSMDELNHVIKKCKNGKACGIDHIRNEFFKSCPPEMLQVILNFFNAVLNTGIVPESWCIGLIMTLYKNKGAKNDPDNYRGITLLSCTGKLSASMINYKLTNYLDAVGGIGDVQV